MNLRIAHIILCLLLGFSVFAHDHGHAGSLKFEENKGQLPDHVDFRAYVPGGSVFLEGQQLTFDLMRLDEIEAFSDFKHGMNPKMPDTLHGHVFRIHLVNSQEPTSIETLEPFPDYVNYYQGDDPSKWASEVQQYHEVIYRNIYPGIDVRYYSSNSNFKYDFIVHPGADPSVIQMRYEGIDGLVFSQEDLVIQTSLEPILDQHPVSWNLDGEKQSFVESQFHLDSTQQVVGFKLKSYDRSQDLVIDPTLIFSTYTGSTVNNWGSTATYDTLGNMYAGGYVLVTGTGSGAGYPTSTGAYQTSFAGGVGTFKTDMAITKFNASGTGILYSTYLGGNGNEIPHSLVVNDNNQLYILGTTSSTNFPTTSGAYDATFNGGSTIGTAGTNSNSSQIAYTGGSDIVVTKLNAAGTNLLGSTYVGGSGNDGINLSDTLQKAYADEFRGEIIVDENDNCYVATSSGSSDFPIVNGFQTTYGGGLTDGIIFKFNSGLTNLIWSSFIGGEEADAAYSLQFDPSFNVFCTGGTKSTDFPTTNGVLNTSYQGGVADGWLAKVSTNGQTLMASTFLGTNSYDQSFFVQLDLSGFVYVVGQTLGSYPVGPNWVYSVANSGQFLHKLSNDLTTTIFSTRWGSGNGNINLSLTAFLVNECNHIFVSGWGGSLFGIAASTSTGGTTTNGLPSTANAIKQTTDGHDFYFVVFEDSATSILFASFYGGNGGAAGGEHTDGGTSRFDKRGIIYQSACASCGQSNSFPTTTGAYSTSKPSSASCNLAALKYDLVTLEAEADVSGPLQVCINDSVQFENESFGGSEYQWDFGDGTFSSEFEPKHAYSSAGNYEVVLIIQDSVSCVFSDTDTVMLTVIPGPQASVPSFPKICPGESVQLSASGGNSYFWFPGTGLNNQNIQNPIATITEGKTYSVAVSDSCGTDTALVELEVHPDKTDAIGDTSICEGLSGKLWAEGGVSYSWTPPVFLSGANSPRPTINPDTTTAYNVSIVDSFGCTRDYDVTVFVVGYIPEIEAWGDTTICSGERVILSALGTDDYEWFPKDNVLSPFFNNTPAYPEVTTTYVVRTGNACGQAFDSVRIVVAEVDLDVFGDTNLCEGDTIQLLAMGSLAYKWTGPGLDDPAYTSAPALTATSSGWYVVEGRNFQNCTKEDSVYVEVYPTPDLEMRTNPDTITGLHNVLLVAASDAPVRWSSTGYVPCTSCDSITVYPKKRTTYYVQAFDSNGCHQYDSITVASISKIYAPNTFTPDGDGINDVFFVYGHNITEYEIEIWDRWGRTVYRSSDMTSGWNGKKFNTGKDASIGVYTYTIRYQVLPEQNRTETGTINLLR